MRPALGVGPKLPHQNVQAGRGQDSGPPSLIPLLRGSVSLEESCDYSGERVDDVYIPAYARGFAQCREPEAAWCQPLASEIVSGEQVV